MGRRELVSAVLCGLLTCVAFGADAESDERYRLTESTYRVLVQVHRQLDAAEYAAAAQRLRKLLPTLQGARYDQAVAQQTLGYALLGLGDADGAIGTFEDALADDALPPPVAQRLGLELAQQLLVNGRDAAAAARFEQWLDNAAEPAPGARYLAAVAYYRQDRCAPAIEHLRRALAVAQEPQEDWYQLLLACQLQLQRYRAAGTTLTTMVTRYPDNRLYWIQLAGVYQRLDADQRAAGVLALAHRRGVLQSEDILRLARLYLHLQAPMEAARLLDDALHAGHIALSASNWSLLADSLLLAQERMRAIDALQKAAQLAQTGDAYHRLGQVLFELQRWNEARAALTEAARHEPLAEPGRVHLLLGIALFQGGDATAAIAALRRARGYESTREQAGAWLRHVEGGFSARVADRDTSAPSADQGAAGTAHERPLRR